MSEGRSAAFKAVMLLGGTIFGFGLGFSHMARPEVVLNFLQFEDFGLLFVMFGGAAVTGLAYFLGPRLLGNAPVTGNQFERRLKPFDRNVVIGGAIFGIGWGLAGICPGAAYASLGVGNVNILWALAGMFAGAYVQGVLRSKSTDAAPTTTRAD